MTATPITPERLREIAELCGSGNVHSANAAIPELLAEIARLQGEAQADAGRMLKQYTVNAKLIEGGEHALRIVAKRDARISALREIAAKGGLLDHLRPDLAAHARNIADGAA